MQENDQTDAPPCVWLISKGMMKSEGNCLDYHLSRALSNYAVSTFQSCFVPFIMDKSQNRSDICGNCPLGSLDGWWPSSTPFSKTMQRDRHTFLLDSYTAIIENRTLCAITTIKLTKK